MLRTILFASVAALCAPFSASADAPPPPSLKPDRQFASQVVSTQDAEILHAAMDAAADGQWSRVADLQSDARSDIVRKLILWRRASAGPPGMAWGEISSAMDELASWPDQFRMQARAEAIIDESGAPLAEQIAWLREVGPDTGDGKAALALALAQTGEYDAGLDVARVAWHQNSLERSDYSALLSRFGDDLTQEDHRARVDFLLWTRQRSDASRMKSLLTPDWRALVDARIALQASRSGVDAAIDAVPAALQSNAGLLYDRAEWRRKRGLRDAAVPLLVEIDGLDVPEAGRNRLWDERHIAVRREIKDSNYTTAYALSAPHGMSGGADFAEAEWLAGWLALRKQGEAEVANRHFSTLSQGVTTPISQARADYWSGRALEAMNEPDAAMIAFGSAATYNYTFYGQLAAERTGDRAISLLNAPPPGEEARDAFDALELVQALRLLGETGDTRNFRRFAYHLDDMLEQAVEFQLLAEIAEEYQMTDIGVRGAKTGLARGIVAPDAAYPVVNYPLLREPNVERSLMLALSRQESEMNPRAISHANARGLMQFLPSTARLEARQRGLPYRTSWLTDDPGYNMTLGGAHLDTLLDQFNGSYIMTAAAYNAGASRPRQWIGDYGDPRRGEIDPIDWVESIPFSETRNYVQRVLENTQVYRHRLSGQEEEIRLSEDLERGRMD